MTRFRYELKNKASQAEFVEKRPKFMERLQTAPAEAFKKNRSQCKSFLDGGFVVEYPDLWCCWLAFSSVEEIVIDDSSKESEK